MIQLDWEWLVVMCSVSASIGAAVNHFREIYAAAKRPRDEMRESIDNVEKELSEFKREVEGSQSENEQRFKNDLEEIKKLRHESRLSLKGQLTVIMALIDGNHKDELKKRQDEIQTYLIEKE